MSTISVIARGIRAALGPLDTTELALELLELIAEDVWASASPFDAVLVKNRLVESARAVIAAQLILHSLKVAQPCAAEESEQ